MKNKIDNFDKLEKKIIHKAMREIKKQSSRIQKSNEQIIKKINIPLLEPPKEEVTV